MVQMEGVWEFVVNCDLMNDKKLFIIKSRACIVNVFCQLKAKY